VNNVGNGRNNIDDTPTREPSLARVKNIGNSRNDIDDTPTRQTLPRARVKNVGNGRNDIDDNSHATNPHSRV
jgi:hypothetical protein